MKIKSFLSYRLYLIRHKFERVAYEIERKLNPELITRGKCVTISLNSSGKEYSPNLVELRTGKFGTEEVVKSYDDGHSIKMLGNVSMNNSSSTIYVWPGENDDPLNIDIPIYTIIHDGIVYIADNPFLIKAEILKECGTRCIVN